MTRPGLPAAGLAVLLLAGCGSSAPAVFAPTDDCVLTMRRALAEAQFDITRQTSRPTGLAETAVEVEATRTDAVPSALLNTELVASCRYDHNVLVDFHWIKGPLK